MKELQSMERWEVCRLYVNSCAHLYHEKLNRVTIARYKTRKGRTVTSVTCYLIDSKNNLHSLFFRIWDDEYVWLLNSFSHDWPDADFEDLTPVTEQEKEVI